jgi:excisionase family DNA binding protein
VVCSAWKNHLKSEPSVVPLIAAITAEPRMLSIKEVAFILKVCIRTVHTIKKNHQLRFYRVRGQLRFDPADVNDYLLKRMVRAA